MYRDPPFLDRLIAEVGVSGKEGELLVSVLWDFEPPDHGDNEGVDRSGDSCKCAGRLDFIGEPNRYVVNTLVISSPEVAEPTVFSVCVVLTLAPVRCGSSC